MRRILHREKRPHDEGHDPSEDQAHHPLDQGQFPRKLRVYPVNLGFQPLDVALDCTLQAFNIPFGGKLRLAGCVLECLCDAFGLALLKTGFLQPADEFQRVGCL